ncbi:matrixin family metalloprotease [Streptomyces sp. NPDC006798]|uniref:matrixin family metalloprotease n=1 Tax=Streptomyces sp. NPDC006798 TaxID=3155462 RepID=UPI003405D1B9
MSLISFQGAPAQAAGAGESAKTANCQLPPGTLTPVDLPPGASVIDCGAVGRVVEDGGAGLTIPEPGNGVTISTLMANGDSVEFALQVDDAGVISYNSPSGVDPATGVDTPQPAPPADPVDPPGTPDTPDDEQDVPPAGSTPIPDTDAAAAPGACSTSAYNLMRWKEYGTYTWYIGDGGMPAGLSRTAAKDAFADAINNITGGSNNCGIVNLAGPRSSYGGTTSLEADISNHNTCTARDKKSTWDAGDLIAGAVASACTWTKLQGPSYADVIEADVRFNTADHNFTNNPSTGCNNKYDVRSVGTHEAGHVFGLDHVTGSTNQNQTMYTNSFPCTTKARTLARGDMNGLRAIYMS